MVRDSLGEACTYPEILEEVSRAIWIVRQNAEAWHTAPDAIVRMGFSAGAPWDNTNTIQRDPRCYNPDCARIAKDCTPELDFIHYVGPHVPPLFLWHNRCDRFVPAVNPARIAGKLLELDRPFALHIFQGGEHGMSVCNRLSSYDERARERNRENPNAALWVPLCVNWINGLFHIA